MHPNSNLHETDLHNCPEINKSDSLMASESTPEYIQSQLTPMVQIILFF